MSRVVASARPLLAISQIAGLLVCLALLGGCMPDLAGAGSVQFAPVDQEAPAARRSVASPAQPEPDWAVRQCRPPKSLCGLTVKELEQGGFLDFRAAAAPERPAARLVSPFAVVRIDTLDRGRCPAKLCAAHVALAALFEDLLRQGYYTHSVALYPGSAVVTLRSERMDHRTQKALKGGCRFNLDLKCTDSDAWLQEDQRSGEHCGFAQTRVFVASATPPEFVGAASLTPAAAAPAAMGAEALRSVAFDTAGVKVYELVYVHKICRSEMTLVRNG